MVEEITSYSSFRPGAMRRSRVSQLVVKYQEEVVVAMRAGLQYGHFKTFNSLSSVSFFFFFFENSRFEERGRQKEREGGKKEGREKERGREKPILSSVCPPALSAIKTSF